MQFVVIDETNGATTTSGEKLDAKTLAMCCRVFTIYLNRLVGGYWGIAGGAAVRAAGSPLDILSGEWPCHVGKDLPAAPNAIAYHDWMGGQADIYDGITLSPNLLGPDGWTTSMTHEFAETAADVETNIMRRDNAGHLYDQEIGDPVEVQSFPMTVDADGTLRATPSTVPGFADDGSFTCYVSNFVLESYFTPGGKAPFDYMTLMDIAGASGPPAAFTPAAAGGGDYQMLETDPGDDTQVMAARTHGARKHVLGTTTYRQAKKAHFSSRTARRGLNVPSPSAPSRSGFGVDMLGKLSVEDRTAYLARIAKSLEGVDLKEIVKSEVVEAPPTDTPTATAPDELTAEAQRLGLYEDVQPHGALHEQAEEAPKVESTAAEAPPVESPTTEEPDPG